MSEITLAMPRLGETMDEGIIANWLITPGQAFRRGEPLVEIETDKTLVEYPALGDGMLVTTLVEPGANVAVGDPIARIVPAAAADWSDSVEEETAPVETPAPVAAPAAAAPMPVAAPTSSNGRVRATPVARRLARNAGIDIGTITGNGPRGRIERRDVEAVISGTSSARPASLARDPSSRRVIMVHGFAGDGRTWSRMAAQLRRAGLDVEMPDMPGHGTNLAEAIDVASLVTDLVARIKASPEPVHLVGHSLGAAVATLAASAVSGQVASLTLLAPAGLGREIASDFVKGMAGVTAPGELEHLLHYLGNGTPASDEMLAEMAQELRRGRLVRLADALVGASGQKVAILRQIEKLAAELPVSVIFGLDDKVIPASHATALPIDVSVHYVAGAGHMPQWDQPDALAALISRKITR
jgi:pimeloyl-ACP methyl ester carboxylesterase